MDIVTAQPQKKLHPHKFTLWVAIASIIMMFAGLTSAYIIKSKAPNWEVIDAPRWFFVSTALLLVSSITMQMALRQFKQRDMRQYRLYLLITTGLGLAFVTTQYFGFQWMWNHGVSWQGAGQGQFLYIIAGLHALHVIGGIVALCITAARAYFSNRRSYNPVPVEVLATYWHFVDALWLYLLIFFVLL